MQQVAQRTPTYAEFDAYLRRHGYHRMDHGTAAWYRHSNGRHRFKFGDTSDNWSKPLPAPVSGKLTKELGFHTFSDMKDALITNVAPPVLNVPESAVLKALVTTDTTPQTVASAANTPTSVPGTVLAITTPTPAGTTSEQRVITPEDAIDLVASTPFDRQRTLSRAWIAKFAAMMRKGQFLISTLKVGWFDGRYFLLDGQHRLHACVESEVPLTVMLEVHPFETFEALTEQYVTIDRNRVRTMSDLIRASDVAEDVGVPPTFLKAIGAAQPIIDSNFNGANPSGTVMLDGQDRLAWYLEWGTEIRTYYQCLAGARKSVSNKLIVGAVAAVALATLRDDRDFAIDFWTTAANDDGLKRNSPHGALLAWIEDHRARLYRADIYAKHVGRAWAAAKEDRDIMTLMLHNTDAAIDLPGTRYRRTRVRTATS